jgi:hypothetical protein
MNISEITAVKSFITLDPGADATNPLFFATYAGMFVPGKHFLPRLMLRLGLTLGEHLVRLTVRIKDCKALLSSELTIR